MPLLDEEEAAMTPYASDGEAAAPAPAAVEADAAAEAERERRAKEEEERRRVEKQRLLKARAAEIVRKERMSKGDAAERFREALPKGNLVTVPDCGHNVHSQNTLGFIDAVGKFLSSLE